MEEKMKTSLKRFVPNRELHFFIKNITGEEPRGYVKKEALIERLDELIKKDSTIIEQIQELIIKYRHAGRGSVSWSVPKISKDDDGKDHKGKFTKKEINEFIISKNGSNPFEVDLKPKITVEPSLNNSEWLRDDLLKLEYVYSDKSQFVEENYQIKEIKPTRRASILVRLLGSSLVFESRANFNKARILHRMAADLLDMETEILDYSYEDVENLKNFLDAKKRLARHKMSAGDFDTMEVTASPVVDDLDESDQYATTFIGDELRKAMYKFRFRSSTGAQTDVTMYLSNKGSLWFVSEVPEEVIEHVFSGIRTIKGF